MSFWARGGVADRLSAPGQYVAQRPAFGDFIGGMCLAGGVAAALFRRERSGEGIEIDVSLLGTAMWVMSPDITAALMYGNMLPTAGEMPVIPNPLVGNYRCGDGKSLVLRAQDVEEHDQRDEQQEPEQTGVEEAHRSNRRWRKYWMTIPSNGQDVSMRR